MLNREGAPIEIETDGQAVREIRICPNAFLERVVQDFHAYISQLRDGSDRSLTDRFDRMWRERAGRRTR